MITMLFKYGLDILIFCGLTWVFVVTARTKAKRRKRKTFLLRKVLLPAFIVYLLVVIAIPTVFGSVFHRARYLPQLIEAHKLRVYWQAVCLLPGLSGSDSEIQYTINEVASEYTMNPDLIRAIVRVESSNNQFAISNVGGCGLMQVMPNTYYSLRTGNPFTVRSNLRAGTEYLRSLYRRFNGNIEMAIAAYNIGPGTVARHGRVPPGDVSRYVDKVMWWYRQYRPVQ